MATKVSMLLSLFLLAILPIPFLTSAGELPQNLQTHAVSGEGKAEEAGHAREVTIGALAPNSPPNVPVRPWISYSPHRPCYGPPRPIYREPPAIYPRPRIYPCRPINPTPYNPPSP